MTTDAPAQSVDERLSAIFAKIPWHIPVDDFKNSLAARGLAVVDARPASASRVEAIAEALAENIDVIFDDWRDNKQAAISVIAADPLTAVAQQMREALQMSVGFDRYAQSSVDAAHLAIAAYDKLEKGE